MQRFDCHALHVARQSPSCHMQHDCASDAVGTQETQRQRHSRESLQDIRPLVKPPCTCRWCMRLSKVELHACLPQPSSPYACSHAAGCCCSHAMPTAIAGSVRIMPDPGTIAKARRAPADLQQQPCRRRRMQLHALCHPGPASVRPAAARPASPSTELS